MTQCWEEVAQLTGNPQYADLRFNADTNTWESARAIIGDQRVTLGPQASQQWTDAPDHLAFVLSRYRAAASLIGDAQSVLEMGCGEGIGARILAKGRSYKGVDLDEDAIAVATNGQVVGGLSFLVGDILKTGFPMRRYGAVVSLDVIEHVPADREGDFMAFATGHLDPHGVCVIGTPNAAFDHLASPQSRAGHCNTYTHERLYMLMARHFRVVQSFGMQDTSIHLGHPEARHYMLMAGIGPREEV